MNAVLSYEIRDLPMCKALRLKTQINNVLDNLYIQGGNGQEFFPAAERNWFVIAEVEL